MSEACIFCRIIQGDLPARIIHRDDRVVAFHDVQPQAPVHILVVPTRHIPALTAPEACAGETLAAIFETIVKLADQLGLDQGFRVVANCGPDGGQTVSHVHYHLLGKRAMQWPPG